MDGYIGWALAMYLRNRGHEVAEATCPQAGVGRRGGKLERHLHKADGGAPGGVRGGPREKPDFYEGDLRDPAFVRGCFKEFGPEAILHLGEQPRRPTA
jgi:nucleoside-diphosphate-sugar epimerase